MASIKIPCQQFRLIVQTLLYRITHLSTHQTEDKYVKYSSENEAAAQSSNLCQEAETKSRLLDR